MNSTASYFLLHCRHTKMLVPFNLLSPFPLHEQRWYVCMNVVWCVFTYDRNEILHYITLKLT